MNPVLAFLLKQYAAPIKAAVAHAVTALVSAGIAWLLVKWPGFDSFSVQFLGGNPAAVALSLSATLCVAINAILTALANNPKLVSPEVAAVLQAIATAKALPLNAPTTTHDAGQGVTVTVKPAGPPQSEGKGTP